MTKYDAAFKLHVVQEYLAGKQSYPNLAKQYKVAGSRQIKKWVDQYLAFGQKAFTPHKKKQVYTVQMKLDVLNFMKKTHASPQKAAQHFRIPDPSIISTWKKKLLENGVESLVNSKEPSLLIHRQKTKKTMSYEKQLEKENERLRAELAFIKKLRASGKNIPSHLIKSKLELSRSFDKHSD
ncbi:helix-turn-helix domain-containing protein [Listeria fleischmannii]|uniref:helix-turn-helix domain-containing protein n=1 Tax=Listeria fleischmannii TaxID=1069827 RepID=UPI0016270E53|nr:helix-turn-helix domain-containing protein [Listeria fleischmannii]MBC1419899.1 transposase [Listeria fleischmannii]